jgi:hypothetical protein
MRPVYGYKLACRKYTTASEIYLKSSKPAAAVTTANILIRLTILSEVHVSEDVQLVTLGDIMYIQY